MTQIGKKRVIIMKFNKKTFLQIAVGVTLLSGSLLLYVCFYPSYIYRIVINEDFVKGVKLKNKVLVASSEGNRGIIFKTDGDLSIDGIPKIGFCVNAPNDLEWYLQDQGYVVYDRQFFGTVYLGSSEYPVTKNEDFSYKITDLIQGANGFFSCGNMIFNRGTINVTTYEKQVIGPHFLYLITFLSFSSAVLQILVVCLDAFWAESKGINSKDKSDETDIKYEI